MIRTLRMAKKFWCWFFPMFWWTKNVKFHFKWGKKLSSWKHETRSRLTSFQDIILFCFTASKKRQGDLLATKQNVIKWSHNHSSVLKTMWFCNQEEVFKCFFHSSKHGKGKSISKKLLLSLSGHCRFYQGN